MDDLAGQTAVVTGAASGIGSALARAFAAEGMRVVCADIDFDGAVATVAELEGTDSVAVGCDVSQFDDVEVVAATHPETGVLCLNAGVFQGGLAWERPLDDWQWVLDVNVWGVIHGIKAFVPRMIERGLRGHVVITASMAGHVATPGSAPYTASKFAAYAIAECLAHDLAMANADVGVSVLCPNVVSTEIHRAERNRPGGATEQTADASFVHDALRDAIDRIGADPSDVARRVVDAVRHDQFLVLTDDGDAEQIRRHADALCALQLPAIGRFGF